ncbi:MAG: transglutaminase-like domain-containing protein [Kiritimatiellae bacterium]|jgi:hypothetical protein|nr:transglutaminase-like domain-containing protein [Kiritimatiellia bacterium]
MFSIRFNNDKDLGPQKRSRWIPAAGAAVLLWVSWWYCSGGNLGLFVLTAIVSIVAVAMSKTFPLNSRWTVWTWLTITILCIIVNIDRIIPPTSGISNGYITNRVVTVFYAYGLSSLLFCAGHFRITSIAFGCMPVIMSMLWESTSTEMSLLEQRILIWGYVLLFVVLDDIGQWTHKVNGVKNIFGLKENIVRASKLIAIVVLAIFMFRGVEASAFKFQDFVLGFDVGFLGGPSRARRSADMFLGAALPRGFHKRERLILLIDADRRPGYLRENVYTDYVKGHWVKGKNADTNSVAMINTPYQIEGELIYSLTGSELNLTNVWNVDVISPRYISAICLPVNAVAIWNEDNEFQIRPNGEVYPENVNIKPERYKMSMSDMQSADGVMQIPSQFDSVAYLDIPTNIVGLVSNWMTSCVGYEQTTNVQQAVSCLQNYFAKDFSYRLDARLNRRQPLVDFMKKRKGFCVHFASATAMLLRGRGIPSRVVGGYVCSEWNPWIKRFVVREREGHAWVEAWDEDAERWITVDTTPASDIPYSRNDTGIFRLSSDWLLFWWKKFLYSLQRVNILLIAGDALTVFFMFVWGLLWGPVGGIALVLAVAYMWWRWRIKKQKRDDALREKLTAAVISAVRKMVPDKLQRTESESWDLWLLRIKHQLDVEVYEELFELVEGYQQLRYQKNLNHKAAEEWMKQRGK